MESFQDMLKQDLPSNLASYGAYHQNFYNQLIHLIFVPSLVLAHFIFAAYLHRLIPLVWAIALAVFYISLDQLIGTAAGIFYIILGVYAGNLVSSERKTGSDSKAKTANKIAFKLSMTLFILGWFMQIVPGHAYFEGVKPKLLDSLSQAFVLAPLFVFYEVFWMINPSYRPELKAEYLLKVAEIKAANNL